MVENGLVVITTGHSLFCDGSSLSSRDSFDRIGRA
jgi:hypothetical protein